MSNQLVYFLSRDKNILKKFIELLNEIKIKNNNIEKIKWNNEKEFKIIREHEKIDILLESDTDIIIIENKIDSGIVEYDKNDKNEKRRPKPKNHILNSSSMNEKQLKNVYNSINQKLSQLSKYYKYIMEDYENNNMMTKDEILEELESIGVNIKELKRMKKEYLINLLNNKNNANQNTKKKISTSLYLNQNIVL